MKSRTPDKRASRDGFVLIVVTLTVVILTLAAYTYSGTMLVESRASMMGGRDVSARTSAESAIELVATRILERDNSTSSDAFIDLYNNSEFKGQILVEDKEPRNQIRFSVVTPDETNSTTGAIRFGVSTENAKFNINKLLELDQLEEALPEEEKLGLAAMAIENIPNMNEGILDCILDWLDSDEDRRPYGAEAADYAGLTIPYEPRNGPMEDIEELLKVQGVEPEFFYGEDANQNGLLDDGEDANEDGILNLGWSSYLTASSREKNTTPEGDEKININMGEMTALYDAVEAQFGADAASFIVAYRLAGTEYAEQGIPSSPSGIQDQISRNEIDLTIIPTYQFKSLYDLIGGETNPTKMTSGADESFTSPWAEGNVLNDFPEVEKYLTVTDDAFVEGRVNINMARLEVMEALTSIGELDISVAEQIILARPPATDQASSANVMARRETACWVFAEGIIDLETLRTIGPYITTGGDVYTFSAVGHYDQGGPSTRLHVMIDATEAVPTIRRVRDLTNLGRGYHPKTLIEAE